MVVKKLRRFGLSTAKPNRFGCLSRPVNVGFRASTQPTRLAYHIADFLQLAGLLGIRAFSKYCEPP